MSCQNGDCAPVKGAAAPTSTTPASTSGASTGSSAAATPPPADASNPGARLHNGFYLRIAVGGGFARQGYTTESQGVTYSSAVYGGAFNSSFLLGGTIVPGLVIGGGNENSVLLAASGGDGRAVATHTPAISFNVYGAFADYYFDPRRGLHAQLMLGVGVRNRLDGVDRAELGPALVAGFGQDWWVSEEWSIGVLGRLQAYQHTVGDKGSVTYLAPGVLASFTYH